MPRSAATPLLAAALCLALPGARPAGAAIASDAQVVVTRYLEATGGAAAFAAESTGYEHARVTGFGFTGSFESWSARPDRRYTRTQLGPFALAEGAIGTTAWRTDPTTGKIVPLADHDLADALVDVWFGLERWAEPDQGGGDVRLAGHERDSTGRYVVLEVAPPPALIATASGGSAAKPRRLWFDESTGLLARIVSANDQREVVTVVSDWRRDHGRMRPFANETRVTGMAMNRLVATTDSIAVNPVVAGQPFAAPAADSGGTAVRWLASPGVAVLPFDYFTRHLWLKASLDGGPPQDVLFDTGASVTVLDSAFAAGHGITTSGHMQATGAGASGGASFATLRSLRIVAGSGDGVELPNEKVAVLNVNGQFAPLFWKPIAGIIGHDIISRFVVTVDYDARTLTLRDPKTWSYAGRETPLPMVMNGTVPAVRGALDDTFEGLFRLDVGSSSTVDLHTPFVKAHALDRHVKQTLPITGVGFGGAFRSTIGRMRSMRLGSYTWDDPIVVLSNATEGAFASEDFAGNIGNRALERFRVTFDYDRRQVILEPGAAFARRDALTRAGLLLTRAGDVVTASSLLPGSPARRAGVREGDRVLAIDGRDATTWDPAALETLFETGAEDREVPITVERDGRQLALTMRLREMMP